MKDTKSTILIFFVNGTNSLIGWSAVLASLDYFADRFKDYNIYSFLPLPLFLGYICMGLLYHTSSHHFTYITHIIAGNMTVNIALLLLLLDSIFFDQMAIGFYLMLIFSFLIGVGSNSSALSFFAMINYLSESVVSKFTVGTAVSGLVITIIRVIITAIFGSDNKTSTPIVIYIAIAMAINTADIILNIYFCKSDVYEQKIHSHIIRKNQKHHTHDENPLVPEVHRNTAILSINGDKIDDKQFENQLEASDENSSDRGQQQMSPTSDNTANAVKEKHLHQKNYFIANYETCMQILPYPFIIMFTFVITFTMFPGPTFVKIVPGMDTTWCVLVYNIAYSIGDTIGKYSAELKNIFNSKSLIFIFFARLLFFIPISVMATGADLGDVLIDNTFFPFFNELLFGITNGFCINASFIMAFQVCPHKYKKYAGVLCGFLLQIGIMLGTVVQIPYAIILGIN